jgi:chemotaxis protein methyltransferase CheR
VKRRNEPQLPLVDALMREHTGLTVRHLQDDERLRLLSAAMRKAGFSDDATYALFLRTYPSSLLDLASQLSVGETYFYRDPGQLRVLTDVVLPRLLVARSRDHIFNFWSAGCASGEEAYTLAMLLEERGLLARAQIVGTDISEVALTRARAGRYSPWSLRATSKLAQQRYFRPLGRDYALSPAIVERVRFERQGLTDAHAVLPGNVSGFDVIFCRNVLIYFTDKACMEASERLARALAVDGTLFAGATDPFVDLPLWRRETREAGVTFSRVDVLRARANAGPDKRVVTTPQPLPYLPLSSELDAPRPAAVSARPVQTRRVSSERPLRPEPMPHTAERAEALQTVRDVGKHEGNERAIDACRRALEKSPDATDLQLWLAALLLELDRDAEAEVTLRTLLYLDRKLIMGHLLSALLARRRGDHTRAARAYQRVVTLCAARDDEEPVPMGEGLDHRTLAENAAAELRALSKLGKAS